MEEAKAQALHDALSKSADRRGKAGGLGLGSGAYNWRTTQDSSIRERNDGLPNNPLYATFVREGSFDPPKSNHGDGRVIKRNFDDCKSSDDEKSASSSISSVSSSKKERPKKKKKKLNKEEKKAAKLEVKR